MTTSSFDPFNVNVQLNRIRIAHHEGGHAVAAWVLGLGVSDVAIDTKNGHSDHAMSFQDARRQFGEIGARERFAIVQYAGGVAQRRWRPDTSDFGCDSDTINANKNVETRVQARLTATRAKVHPRNKGGRPARYLLSGLLTCSSCGGHYILRNGRSYACSSHSNGRDSICAQRRSLNRDRTARIQECWKVASSRCNCFATRALHTYRRILRGITRAIDTWHWE